MLGISTAGIDHAYEVSMKKKASNGVAELLLHKCFCQGQTNLPPCDYHYTLFKLINIL